MDIIIQSLGFKAGETLESFITEKVKELKGDKIVRANVTLFKGPDSNPESDYCEIRLEVPGNDHFVKKNSAHFEVAVTDCLDVLAEMLSRSKEKSVRRRQAGSVEIQDALIAAEANSAVAADEEE